MEKHRYWRVSNLKTGSNAGMIAAEIVFYNSDGEDMSIGGSALSSEGFNDFRGDPERAFDKNSSTDFLNAYTTMSLSEAYIGYKSPTAYELTHVGLLMRQGGVFGGDKWQTAAIEYSDDGVAWFSHGFIAPLFETTGIITTERISAVQSASTIRVNPPKPKVGLNVYIGNGDGFIAGLVTQGKPSEPKIPLKSEVLLYDRMTNKLIKRTWSDSLGNYSFGGLDTGREYYAVTLHPNRTYNAAVQDGLKSGMTT